jgi:hypothetical protein
MFISKNKIMEVGLFVYRLLTVVIIAWVVISALTVRCTKPLPSILSKPSVSPAAINNNTSTTTTTIQKPDGTVSTTTTVIDKTITNPPRNNRVRTEIRTDILKPRLPIYEFGYERRVLNNFWIGTQVTTDKQIGISIGVDF